MDSLSTAEFEESISGTNEVRTCARRKLTSTVWNSFEKITKPNGKVVAICNHCGSSFVGDSGTSNLKNHLKRKHKELVGASDSSLNASTQEFSQEKSRRDLAIMLIKHNYPLSMVDHKYFRIYSHGLNPEFVIHSRNSIRSDIISIYKEEKEKMYSFLESVSSKVTLTTDIWTSDHQNLAYICLTAHFIDENWELKNKILAYRHIEYPHDGDTLFKFIRDLVLEWNLDKKLFAMVVDNASSNDVMVRKLKFWLQEKSLLSLEGSLFYVVW
ncbi:putative transcription factor/ chromatin remodeling BED-type(Zn) family [Helianthus annuus]|nr:putative transcription factor/ chromatin remodeling BED-type(Zn) family [Helianthus annuus]KAJ0649507.1 putative transcription factor/ chromatin remodeling BED-type(Zn) family [Helianthus annuus]